MSCVTMVKAALARFLFGLHTLVTVWRVVSQVRSHYYNKSSTDLAEFRFFGAAWSILELPITTSCGQIIGLACPITYVYSL